MVIYVNLYDVGILVMMIKICSVSSLGTAIGCFEVSGRNIWEEEFHQQTDWDANSVTTESCAAACRGKDYRLAAVRDGQECYCRNDFPKSTLSKSCNVRCTGNPTEWCGGDDGTAVNIFTVCENGTYKDQLNTCARICNCNTVCHQVTGVCQGECRVNFTFSSENKCDACIKGNYGENCTSNCVRCKYDKCSKDNGKCTEGCIDGYYGEECDDKCGQCNNATCNRTSGVCLFGCKMGYYQDKCDVECGKCAACKNDTLGMNCSNACDQCKGKCNAKNGVCTGGCKNGQTNYQCNNSAGPINLTVVVMLTLVAVIICS